MASMAEQQPVKKRKLYDSSKDQPPWPRVAFPLSQEEIIRRRRSKEEIRNLYECYKRIKYCVSRKDSRLMADFEQAYLSLITASRGCTSVQRIVAELIPRYAEFCPTALEAAAKVSVNMYNWSLGIIMRGEDLDGVAYHTAIACIFGLVDICCTATHEAPTSSVIRGICAAVFQNVLIFFTSNFEGKDIYDIGSMDIVKLQSPIENFRDLKQEKGADGESSLNKLFKYSALCLLRIFFSFPKNILAACFELIGTGEADANNKQGQYFLDQVTSTLKADAIFPALNKKNDEVSLSMDLAETSMNCEVLDEEKRVSRDIAAENKPCSSINCFMGMVLSRDSSLKNWILARYKKLENSLNSHGTTSISSFLEKVFGPMQDLLKDAVYEQSDDENFDSSSHIRHMVYKKTVNDDNLSDFFQRDLATTEHQNTSLSKEACATSITPKSTSRHNSLRLSEVDSNIANQGFVCEGERFGSVTELETANCEVSYPGKLSRLNSSGRNQLVSTIRTDVTEADTLVKDDKKNDLNAGHVFPSSMPPSNVALNSSPFKKKSVAMHCTPDHVIWHSDGDPVAMNVFPASKLLWLGSLGYLSSETSVRHQFEKFGQLEQFIFLPVKYFALVEYRNLMDAIKARECMQGSTQWGGFLKIKFIDLGLGCRGISNGVAIGDSCHVYVGKLPSHWSKEEMLHLLIRKGVRSPVMVTDLTSESAVLLEFGSAEDAATAMAHIRQLRQESQCQLLPNMSFSYSTDRLRDMGIASNFKEYQPSQGSSMTAGYFSAHVDPRAPSRETVAQASYSSYLSTKQGSFIHELASPRVMKGLDVQSNWSIRSNLEMTGSKKAEEHDCTPSMDLSLSDTSSRTADPVWLYKNSECGVPPLAYAAIPLAHGIMPHVRGNYGIPPPIHSTSSVPPFYPTNNSWDNPSHNPAFPFPHDRRHISSQPPLPFIPSSITPLSHIPAASIQRFDRAVSVANMPTSVPPPPPLPEPQTSLPCSPPPLPPSQPPLIPPLPTSPPPVPQPIHETPKQRHGKRSLTHQWQGTLSKSGIHYCTLYATRECSLTCKYINAALEPTEWPAKLEVTKRTDFRHVTTTFGNTPPHRREVCRLLPSTTNDHKGFNDFISYLRQRECAGVIKIPAVKSMWARLLFILPHSLEFCSMLGISPQPVTCLIALVLPKETNADLV